MSDLPEEAEAVRLRDKELAAWADENHGAPDLVERMAHAIPVRLVKSEAVGIGAARREAIARAVLPVVENEVARARADERRKVAEEIARQIETAPPFHWTRTQARAWAARVARQIGEARG